MTHVDCTSKVRLVIRSFLHPYPKTWVAIGHAIMYYARSAHIFSARIKCRHCISLYAIFARFGAVNKLYTLG